MKTRLKRFLDDITEAIFGLFTGVYSEEITERRVRLLTIPEFVGLRNGTRLISITGEYSVKGEVDIDMDVRGGLIAHGWEMHPRDPDFSRGWKIE